MRSRRVKRRDRGPGTTFGRSPSEYYIKYVLSRDLDRPAPEVVAELEGEGVILPLDGAAYVEELASGMRARAPSPFHPQDLRHGASVTYLYREGIWALWHDRRVVEDAVRIQASPWLRERVIALLAMSFEPTAIIRLLGAACTEVFQESSIQLYESYFWNLLLLAPDEGEALHADPRIGPIAQRVLAERKPGKPRSEMLVLLGLEPKTLGREWQLQEELCAAYDFADHLDSDDSPEHQLQALQLATKRLDVAERKLARFR